LIKKDTLPDYEATDPTAYLTTQLSPSLNFVFLFISFLLENIITLILYI